MAEGGTANKAEDTPLTEEIRVATQIVQAIENGDPGAERMLVERYARGLTYLVTRRLGDEDLAQEVVQDTLMITIQKIRAGEIEEPARLAGYLRGVAIRTGANAGRKQQRAPVPVDSEIIEAVVDEAADPVATIEKRELSDAVKVLLDELPVDRDREILLRHYVKEQDKSKICSDLGLDSAHFSRVLYRAKQRFRSILEGAQEKFASA